jgi:hypothetical protein
MFVPRISRCHAITFLSVNELRCCGRSGRAPPRLLHRISSETPCFAGSEIPKKKISHGLGEFVSQNHILGLSVRSSLRVCANVPQRAPPTSKHIVHRHSIGSLALKPAAANKRDETDHARPEQDEGPRLRGGGRHVEAGRCRHACNGRVPSVSNCT